MQVAGTKQKRTEKMPHSRLKGEVSNFLEEPTPLSLYRWRLSRGCGDRQLDRRGVRQRVDSSGRRNDPRRLVVKRVEGRRPARAQQRVGEVARVTPEHLYIATS